MARKYSSTKPMKNKIEPSVLTLTFTNLDVIPGLGSSRDYFVDLSQVASLVNRRFYRQGINWAVGGFKFLAGSDTRAIIQMQKLPNTWVTSNAWEKAFRAWERQQDEALEEAGAESMRARFNDFKVFADVDHVTQFVAAGSDLNATNLLPFGFSLTGEWDPSQIVIPNQTLDATGSRVDPKEYLLHMVGTNDNAGVSRGVLEGYADSRSFPQSPDPVGPAIDSFNNWLRDMFDVGNDNQEITENATERNNNLPYDQENYPGGETQAPILQLHDQEFITGTTIGGTTRIKGGNFPCGLIKVSLVNMSASESVGLTMQIDLIPGSHRGYLCESMTEM